ncbi:MAG: SRPBCC family protein [Prevotella sp.]|nr:SRPBCC family protein [Prevotella sp.]
MVKYESSIKQVPYAQQAVYEMLSDLNNIDRVRDRLPEDKLQNITFDRDSVSVAVPPIGEIALHVCDREEPKCVKFEAAQSPIPFNLWVQMLPVTETSSKLKVTLQADIPLMLKAMVGSRLQEGVEQMAEMLAMIPYEK